MKKITLLTALLFSFVGFSQSNNAAIQTYLETNRAKFGLTTQDISDWVIESEVPGSGTGITSTYIVQRYKGIEIFNAQSNAWVKNNTVLKIENNFQNNIANKINTTTPTLSALQAITNAYLKLGIFTIPNFVITETINSKSFKISDGLQEDPILGKLVYHYTLDKKMKLAWSFQFRAPQSNDTWDLRIDATNGDILEKNNLTITCNFGHKPSDINIKKNFSFENALHNNGVQSILVANPGTYRVIPFNFESPNHHPFELITTSGNELASPNGWHDANGLGGTTASLKYTYTRGNNVLAQEDADGNNGSGIRADGGASLTFDFPYVNGVAQTQQPTTYTSAATTNLFYMNNIMHDVWYQYGFNEASGNFQRNNYGRGGVTSATGDPVLADAQDGWNQTTATLNNANFSAFPDGSSQVRMQMFMWTLGAPPTNFITINSPSSIAGPMSATTNVFEGTDRIPVPTAPNGITSDLVLYTNTPVNPTQNPNSACQAPTNPFAVDGKIVLIKRGGCNFSNKVKNAQDANALAVIVIDTVANNPSRLSMSSTGLLGILIPAVFISKEKGDILINELINGPVNVKLEVPQNLYLFGDGDFDNGIMSHEYTHGISNRLTGGPATTSCLNAPEQQGEGWSDWATLMMQLKSGDTGATPKPIGTFAINEAIDAAGIRFFPYCTDMSVNPLTFGFLNRNFPTVPPTVFSSTFTDPSDSVVKVEPHNTGEVWCSMLWDLTWAYINKYGFDSDVYTGTGGNNKVMRLVLDGMKLQPCNPSYIQARDAIIAADQATTGGQDFCMIWQVFARRGLGINASSGDNSGNNLNLVAILDEVEDFTEPAAGPNCTLAVNYFNNEEMIRVYPNPTNGLLNIRVNQFVGKATIQIVDINGRIVFNQIDDKFNIEKSINISGLQSGIYVLKITGKDLNYSQKLIKN